jgi:hypothetical protein
VPIQVAVPLYPHILGFGIAMSEDPGVQFMGARSKVSNETSRWHAGQVENGMTDLLTMLAYFI